nr:hypothetical protein [Tanacetum cinerariifolium]
MFSVGLKADTISAPGRVTLKLTQPRTYILRWSYEGYNIHTRTGNLTINLTTEIETLGSEGNLRSCLSGQGGLGGYSESRSGRSGSRETKWKGSSNKEVNGYKLWYSGSQTARNGVGVILRACLKDKVVHMNWCNDRIIPLTLVIEGETVNVISTYAPQVGRQRKDTRVSTKDSGNSYFKKKDHHLITFQSGGRCTQIDYLLVRRGDLKACKDFPREACSSQHRLLVMDTLFKRVQRRRVGSAAPRILWKNLNGDVAEAFRSRVIEKARQRRRRDLWDICFIKDEASRTIMDEKEIKQRWREYFSSFFNTREPEGHEGVKMGRNKAVGPDQIPIEAWRSLRAEGISWITSLFNKIFTSTKMLEEWRLGDIISIFKNKGDANSEISHNEKVEVCIGDKILQPKESFRYLRSMLHKSRRIDEDVAHRIKAAWLKWRAETGVICDRNVPLKLKGKFYRAAIRPAMLYGSECWPITKALANRMEVAELRMLRWTCGKIMLDMIPNGVYRAELEVETIINKMRK